MTMKLEDLVLVVGVRKVGDQQVGFDGRGRVIPVQSYKWTGLYDAEHRELYVAERMKPPNQLWFEYVWEGDAEGDAE
jgi:hypothetical protein